MSVSAASSRPVISAFVVVQLGCAALITGGGRDLSLALLPFAGAATVGLFLSQLKGIAEHGAFLPEDSTRCVRNHTTDWFGRILLYDGHFELHAKHHERPGMPSGKLPPLVGESATAGRSTMWRTLATMLRSRSARPAMAGLARRLYDAAPGPKS